MDEKIIEELILYMNQTKDFLLHECPDVIAQMFTYQKIWNWTCAISCATALLISIAIFIYFYKFPSLDKYDSMTLGNMYILMASSIICIVCFGVLTDSVRILMKLYIAPKYYLINLILEMKK